MGAPRGSPARVRRPPTLPSLKHSHAMWTSRDHQLLSLVIARLRRTFNATSNRTVVRMVCCLLLLRSLQACQLTDMQHDTQSVRPPSVMVLWETYTHCRTSEHPLAQTLDAIDLDRAARVPHAASPVLLKSVESWVSVPPTRASINLNDMAAACAIHAGRSAASHGWHEIAADLYESVLTSTRETGDNYYVRQAEEGLAELRSNREPHPLPPPSD